MQRLIILSFIVFIQYHSFGQCGYVAANSIEERNRMILFFKQYYDNQSNFRRLRELQFLNKNESGEFSKDTIIIKRHLLRDNIFQSVQDRISIDNWNYVITLANIVFAPSSTYFKFDQDFDIITDAGQNDVPDDNLYVHDEPDVINLYVVDKIDPTGTVYGRASGGIPFYGPNPSNSSDHLIMKYGVPFSEADWHYTLAHELGHLFGLLHTFENSFGSELVNGSNSLISGDFISDTKADNFILNRSNSLGGCFNLQIDQVGLKDCNGELYSFAAFRNIMSYHPGCATVFSDQQLDIISRVKVKYKGRLIRKIWAKIESLTVVGNSFAFCGEHIFSYATESVKNVTSYKWTFIGGTPLGSTTSSQVSVKYTEPGEYGYYLTVTDNSGNSFTTEQELFILEDVDLFAKSIPDLIDFNNGLPAKVTGWDFEDKYRDCRYFRNIKVGTSNFDNKGLLIDNFDSRVVNQSGDPSYYDEDIFLTPYYKIKDKYSRVKLELDVAYSQRNKNGEIVSDTLIIYSNICNVDYQKRKLYGNDLASTSRISNEVAFLPTESEWKHIIIELDEDELIGVGSMRFKFLVKSFSANRLYIDNIKIGGKAISSTNSLVVNYNKGLTRFDISWQDFADDESGYKIERSFSEYGPWVQVGNLSPNETSFQDSPNMPNMIFSYRIKAEGSTMSLPYSNIAFDTTSSLPIRPSNLNANISGNNRVLVSWNSSGENLTGFNLFYAFNRNGSYDTLDKLDPGVTSFIHDNVPSNTRIYYFVKAVDHNFSSLPSDTGFVSFLSPTTSTLTKLEYYFDTDPGPGNGIPVNLNSAHAIDRHFEFPVSSLAEGVHQLYFRVQDNIGNWSNVYSNSFIKLKGNAAPTIVDSVEYYFDQFDPGVGKAARIDLTLIAGPEYTIPVELSSLSDGAHILHMRSRNSKGLWSTYWSGGFIKLPGDAVSIIDKVEYFIDSDPGFGLGINVPINSLSKIDTSIHLNLSTVSTGVHKLYLRARDAAGLWSNVFSRNFIRVLGDSGRYVTELEYYFDSEPGIGNGIKVSFPTPKAKVDTVLNLNLAALSDGMHILYVRSKDVAGQWSNIISKSFFRTTGSGGTPKIIKLEYFVDSDPGLGLASNIDTTTLSPGVYDIELPTSSYALGEHNLYIRAKDSRGFWSVVYSGSFRIVNNTECSCAKLVYTTSKVQSATYQWQVDNGSGFQSIADTGVYFGTHTDSLKISNPPTTYAFNKYRCLITSPSGTNFSSTYELRYNMSWNGGENGDWHDPKNWGCIVVPDENVDVVIPGSRPNNPVITKDSKVGSLKIETGSSVTVAPGIKLEIKK